jgi:hypothetical protein
VERHYNELVGRYGQVIPADQLVRLVSDSGRPENPNEDTIINRDTFFVAIMDPAEGKFSWSKCWPEPGGVHVDESCSW